MHIKGVGEKGIQKLISEPDFELFDYLKSLRPSKMQLFMILAEGVSEKTAQSKYSETALKEAI